MKKNGLSIKERVMIWYSFIMMIAMIVIVGAFFAIARITISDGVESDLVAVVDESMDDIYVTSGELVIDDRLDYKMNGVNISIYDEKGNDLSGMIPDGFVESTPFIADEVRSVGGTGGRHFFVYDRLIENENIGDIWVRGVKSSRIEDNSPPFAFIIRLTLFFIPVMFLLALIGGWFITNKAFEPLNRITSAASSINSGDDLSRRIGFGSPESNDEVMRTAGVFDNMLDKVEMSFESEKQFTDNASHELRNPTAVIMAESEYALGNIDDKEEVRGSLETIHTQSKKMDSIVSSLLILARADRGAQPLNKENTDISLLAEESKASFAEAVREKNITVDVDAEEGIYMDVDPSFFSRIYDNLISNAIKYGKDGGHVNVCVKKDEAGRVVIEVSDDGIGISESDLPHIFDRFYRASDTAINESMGLGLSLVKWIVEEHGGIIICSSTLGEGTVFRMTFDNK